MESRVAMCQSTIGVAINLNQSREHNSCWDYNTGNIYNKYRDKLTGFATFCRNCSGHVSRCHASRARHSQPANTHSRESMFPCQQCFTFATGRQIDINSRKLNPQYIHIHSLNWTDQNADKKVMWWKTLFPVKTKTMDVFVSKSLGWHEQTRHCRDVRSR